MSVCQFVYFGHFIATILCNVVSNICVVLTSATLVCPFLCYALVVILHCIEITFASICNHFCLDGNPPSLRSLFFLGVFPSLLFSDRLFFFPFFTQPSFLSFFSPVLVAVCFWFFFCIHPSPTSTLFPSTMLFRSRGY